MNKSLTNSTQTKGRSWLKGWLLPILNLKGLGTVYWPLYVLGPALGFVAVFKNLEKSTLIFSLIGLWLFFAIPEFMGLHGVSKDELLKLGQIAGGLCFAFLGKELVNTRYFLRNMTILVALALLVEIAFMKPYSYRDFFGWGSFARYYGPYGDGNISIQLYLQIGLIGLLYLKKPLPYILCCIAFIATSGSRTGFILLLSFGSLAVCVRLFKFPVLMLGVKLLLIATLFFCFMQPFIQRAIFNTRGVDEYELIETTTGRYAIHQAYYSQWLKRPWTGYGKEESIQLSHLTFEHKTFFETLNLEQHSIYYQVLASYGVIGYFGFSLIIGIVFYRLRMGGRILLTQLMVGFLTFSGLTSSLLWLSVGIAMAYDYANNAHQRTRRSNGWLYRPEAIDRLATSEP